MTCRPDKVLLAALLALVALPVAAGGRDDPLALAGSAIERGDGVSAEVAARRALDAGLPHSAVDAYLGEAAMLQGDPDEARRWLAAGEFDAASAQRGFHALGRLELNAGNYGAAARAFDEALAAGPDDARLWVDIGRLRYRAGEQHLAVDAVDKALAIDPKEAQALQMEAELVRDSQGLAAALPWFERAAAAAPADLDLLGQYAATLGELGRYGEMLKIARRMVAIDRDHPRAYFLQAVLAARGGQTDLARRLLWRTKGAYDETPAGMLVQGVLAYRAGSTELAVDRFDKLARLQPDNEAVARLLGRALLADGDASELIGRFAERVERPDASPYMLTLVARAYEQLDRRDLAAPLLDRASEAAAGVPTAMPLSDAGELAIFRNGDKDPTGPDVAVPTMRKLLSEGRSGEAVAYAQKLRQRYPASSDIEVLAGDAALLSGDHAGAAALYRSAAKVRWTGALALRIAAAESRMGQGEAAAAELAGYLVQHPQDHGAAALLGRAAAAEGDWQRAMLLFRTAVSHGGGAGDARLLSDLAEAELRGGEAEAALATARRAYALQRSSPRTTAVLAEVLVASGKDAQEGQILLAKARRMGDEDSLALR